MDRTFENIINEGKKNGKTMSEINEELKAAGATFHLDYKMCEDGPVTGWTEAEMKEGFVEPETPPEKVKKLHDYMKFDKSKAGTEETVSTPTGKYKITWDEMGHPIKAVRV